MPAHACSLASGEVERVVRSAGHGLNQEGPSLASFSYRASLTNTTSSQRSDEWEPVDDDS